MKNCRTPVTAKSFGCVEYECKFPPTNTANKKMMWTHDLNAHHDSDVYLYELCYLSDSWCAPVRGTNSNFGAKNGSSAIHCLPAQGRSTPQRIHVA